jgi:hypothetical protein
MEEIRAIRDSELATDLDVHNANGVLRAYEEESLTIEPGKVTYWFNGKRKTPLVDRHSIAVETFKKWMIEEGLGKLWIEDVSLPIWVQIS